MLKTPDDHLLICGEKDSGPMVLKMDPVGNIIWSKRFSNALWTFYALAPTHDSCFLVGGGCNQRGMFVAKMNLSGDTLWTKVVDFGGYFNELASVHETYDHGIIISGNIFHATPTYRYDLAVAKLDSSGNLEWTKTFSKTDDRSLWVATTKQSPDSGFMVCGTYQALNPYIVENVFFMKLSSNGDVIWAKSPILTTSSHNSAMDLMVLDDGLLILGANYSGMNLIRIDASGMFMWGKQTNMHSGMQQIPPSHKINKTTDNCYIFAGGNGMMKTDSLGNFIWGQDLFLNSIAAVEMFDGGYLALGNGPLLGVKLTDTDNPQVGIIKTDSLGNSSDCVFQSNSSSNDLFLEMETISFIESTEEGMLSFNYPTITDPIISIDSGCVAMTGAVHEHQSNILEITTFPNPTTGLFQINVDSKEINNFQSLKVFNMMGEIVYETKSPSVFRTGINLHSPANGIYLVRAFFREAIATDRLIISH